MKSLPLGLLGLLFVSLLAFGQQKATPQTPCGLQSCRSFHELLNRKDADILEKIGKDNEAFVCFREDEDSFFIAEYSQLKWSSWIPDSDNWPKDSTSGPYYAYGSAAVTNYRSGQDDDWYGAGPLSKWKAFGHTGKFTVKDGAPFLADAPGAMFVANCTFPEGEQCSLFIDQTSFKLYRNFKNKKEGTTDYALEIRLSTGRYSETYSWDKSKDADEGETKHSGRCEVYSDGKKVR